MQRRNQSTQQEIIREKLRPPKKEFWEAFRDFIWDSEKKSCMTRTPTNWCAITIFYALFLTGVILVFYISMQIAFKISNMNQHRPQYILKDSPIGTTPTLNYFPMYKASPLIWISQDNTPEFYAKMVSEKFKAYSKNPKFDAKSFGECGIAPYGYDKKTPCVYFKMSRILMWKPSPYDHYDELPDEVPDDVKDLIKASEKPMVWLSCTGTTAKDRDHLGNNTILYQGKRGFDPSVYPYDKQKNFMDSIVAVKVNDSKQTPVAYSITCYYWAKEVDHEDTAVDLIYYFE